MSTRYRAGPASLVRPGRGGRGLGALAVLLLVWAGAQTALAEDKPAPAGTKAAVRLLSLVNGYGRNLPFRVPAGLCFDARRGEIYVADRGNHKIAVFDTGGLPLRSFIHYVSHLQSDGAALQQPGEPRGLAVNSLGDIYVIDGLDDAVDVVDYRGRSMGRLRPADLLAPEDALSSSEIVTPAAVAVDERDRVYIATTGSRCRIVVLDANGQVLRRLGRRGQDRGAFISITGLSVDKQGQLLVTDAQGIPVQVLSPEGEPLLAFGEHAMGPQNFSLPNGAIRDGNGDLWVADAIRHVVRRFDPKGELRDTIGGAGTEPGQMYYPVALAGDGGRLIVVLEKDGARFQVFQVVS